MHRLGYIGQNLYLAGKALGKRIAQEVDSGDVVGFIATPGQLNIQPRLDGAKAAIKESGKNITLHEVASGPTVNEEFSRIESYYVGHKDIKGMFAVDAGSTEGVAKTMAKHDLPRKASRPAVSTCCRARSTASRTAIWTSPSTSSPICRVSTPVMELFLYKLSGGLTRSGQHQYRSEVRHQGQRPGQYLASKSRFEGNSSKQQYLKRSGPIAGAELCR